MALALVISVIIKLHTGVVFRDIFSLNMKVSSIIVIIVIIVIIKLHTGVIFGDIFSLNMKVSSIIVISAED